MPKSFKVVYIAHKSEGHQVQAKRQEQEERLQFVPNRRPIDTFDLVGNQNTQDTVHIGHWTQDTGQLISPQSAIREQITWLVEFAKGCG